MHITVPGTDMGQIIAGKAVIWYRGTHLALCLDYGLQIRERIVF